MNFSSIYNELKRYPFIEKMHICQHHSKKIMALNNLDIFNNDESKVYPWELETFAQISILADGDHATKTFYLKGYDKFIEIINFIRNYTHPYLKQKQGTSDFIHDFIMVTGILQFKIQRNIFCRLYKYRYFFEFTNNKINMKDIFLSSFDNIEYDKFIEFAVLIYFFASLSEDTSEIYKYITQRYLKILNQLTISREEYIVKQNQKNNNNIENCYYGFNYLHSYPFIKFKEFIYLPIPYLVIDSITDSFLTRMTYGNDNLREIIGKEIAQQYIFDILNETNVYEEVLVEQIYNVGKNKIDSPDIMIKNYEQVCLIDSKLSTPKLSLRQFNSDDIDSTINKYSKNIIQLYKRMNEFGVYFNPFKNTNKIEKKNLFGIIVIFDESYISKEILYKKTCDVIGIEYDSVEGKYIRSNINLIGLDDIENFAFNSFNIFTSLSFKRDDPSMWNDISLYDNSFYKDITPKKIKSLIDLEEKIMNIYKLETEELLKVGLVK